MCGLQTIARGLALNRANSKEGARVLTFGQFVGFITVYPTHPRKK